MNIRKNVDYSLMYAALNDLVNANLPQMELYCGIGKVICGRAEKGAAVIAAEYLQSTYPNCSGFSPRNTRRMREFYRSYESNPVLLEEAKQIGWTQNVVIMESELTMEEKAWYIRAVHQFCWSKQKLMIQIADRIHETASLNVAERLCRTKVDHDSAQDEKKSDSRHNEARFALFDNSACIGERQNPIQYTLTAQRHRLRRIRSPVRDGPIRPRQAPSIAEIFRPPKRLAA